ncbi:MAG TPA: sulfatase/phosphatase domain-containing protein, partial [Patescibacteria group bacterium]|nr:sulfatase/phosphatase domain-containing protein [Patescibacteria group bacterium]
GKVRGFSAQANTKDGKNVRFGNRPSIVPGPEDTYASYGRAWANLSNTPFRLYKSWTHQGGIATPLIVHHPELIKKKGTITDQMGQLPDIMATIVDITGAKYPDSYNGNEILPMEGDSLLPSLQGKENGKEELFFEHQGNAAYRKGDFKLVRDQPFDWELYDLSADPTELYDLSLKYPEKRKEMIATYEQWANRIGVKTIKELRKIKHKNKPKLIRNFLAWFESKFGRNHWKWRRLVKKRRKY